MRNHHECYKIQIVVRESLVTMIESRELNYSFIKIVHR